MTVGRTMRKIDRAMRNRLRRAMADTAHFCLALSIRIVYRIGFDRVLGWAVRLPNRRLKGLIYIALSRAMVGIHRPSEMRFAWKARHINRDFALTIVVTSLNSLQKFGALQWWTQRPARTSLVRNLLDEIAIEGLTRANDFDAARRYALAVNIDILLKYRTLAEVALRTGRLRAFRYFLRRMRTAGSEKRRPYLRWLVRLVDRDQNPTSLLPEGSLPHVLQASSAIQSHSDHAVLTQTLTPAPASPTPASSWHQYRAALSAAMARRDWAEAARLADDPVDAKSREVISPAFASTTLMRVNGLAAVGRGDAALSALLDSLDRLGNDVDAQRFLRLAIQGGMRFPYSGALLDRLIIGFKRASMSTAVKTAERWREAYSDGWRLPERRSDRCFIVANGPSIRDMPLGRIAGEDIFCVNRGFHATAFGLPPPRFLVVSDLAVYRDYSAEIDQADVERRFLSAACLFAKPYSFDSKVSVFGSSNLQLSMGGLVPSNGLFHIGGTVVLSACQIAFFMGYREINVLGVDLSYDGPLSHFYGNDAKGARRLGTFRLGDNGEAWVNAGFGHLDRYFQSNGTVMRNVGRGGNLRTLPRVAFEDAVAQSSPPLARERVLA